MKTRIVLFALLLIFALSGTAISQTINNGGAGFDAETWYQICNTNQDGFDPSGWGNLETDLRVSRWNGTSYERYGDHINGNMTRGEGHWYYSLNQADELDCGGYTAAETPDFDINGTQGGEWAFTMIGSPAPQDNGGLWGSNFFINGDAITNRPFHQNFFDYINDSWRTRNISNNEAILLPGQAGWIATQSYFDCQGSFVGVWLTPEDGGDPVRDEPVSGWDLELITASADGEYQHHYNYLGIREDGTTGFDRHDIPELPLPQSDYVMLYFPHSEFEVTSGDYTGDYRSLEFDGPKIWDFTIKTVNIENTSFTLDWAGIDDIPENYTLTLIDADNNSVIGDMRDIGQVAFRNGDGAVQELHYRVTCDYTPEWVGPGSSSLPGGFGLTNAYPNPFNNVVNLEYTLPINQTASLKVYDMTGKLVDTISGNLQGEGTVSWNASGVQSGVYMMQLESGNQVSLKKVILMQ